MLDIIIPPGELFDERTQKFVTVDKPIPFSLEHSLVSLSKWEAKYRKPFLSSTDKTNDEIYDYIAMMILTPGINADYLHLLPSSEMQKINEYIGSEESATTFSDTSAKPKGRSEVITSELIYFWMTSANINWEAQYWHLNQLFNLLRIAAIKNNKPKKMSRAEIMAQNRALNEQRKAAMGTTG